MKYSLITSLQNPKIKTLVKLRQRRQRDRQGMMLIDGRRAVDLALRNGFELDSLYFLEDVPRIASTLLSQAEMQEVALYQVSPAVFDKISYGNSPDGFLALAPQPSLNLEDIPYPENSLYLVAEGLEKPGNLGAILRSADAAGITGLILCDSQTDVYNPNLIRASRGAFFSLPIARTGTETCIQWLAEKEIQILAATPAPESQIYTQVDLRLPTALVLGAEHQGLSQAWLAQKPVRIPMAGQVDSLNVAQTASILIFEAIRQRAGL